VEAFDDLEDSRDTIPIFIILNFSPGFPYEKKVKIGMVSPDSDSGFCRIPGFPGFPRIPMNGPKIPRF
jgi:hypothetical protein